MEFKHEGEILKIDPDHKPMSPREIDPLWSMSFFKKYSDYGTNEIQEVSEDDFTLPIIINDNHVGTMRLSQKKLNLNRHLFSAKHVVQEALMEVMLLEEYINRNTWGFIIEDLKGNFIDSSWSYYGSNLKTNGIICDVPEKWRRFFETIDLPEDLNTVMPKSNQ